MFRKTRAQSVPKLLIAISIAEYILGLPRIAYMGVIIDMEATEAH